LRRPQCLRFLSEDHRYTLAVRAPIKPRIDVNDFRVVVSYLSIGELGKLAAKHGAWIDMRDVRQTSRHGFSILLGHDVVHCMLGDYRR